MPLRLGCSLATSPDSAVHAAEAERLGYQRVWLYDSPALYPDVWMLLTECALATSTIRLGPAVLVPSLRHPMVNASAITQLCRLAPGRVQVAVGSGLTGQVTIGRGPLPWSLVRAYTLAVRGLCDGATVDWEGARLRLIHPPGFGAPQPLGVEWFIGAAGPKGYEVAAEIADGALARVPVLGVQHSIVNTFGTVRGTDEPFDSPRIVAAAGHLASLVLHNMIQRGRGDVAEHEGGREWLAAYAAIDPAERHLALYEQHLVGVPERDRPVLTAEFMRRNAGARTAGEWHAWFDEQVAGGATEVSYQPAGPDIPGELARFAEVFADWQAGPGRPNG